VEPEGRRDTQCTETAERKRKKPTERKKQDEGNEKGESTDRLGAPID